MKSSLLDAGRSDQAAGLLVDIQLALNKGVFFEGVQRTPDSSTPTRLEDFLGNALSEVAATEEREATV